MGRRAGMSSLRSLCTMNRFSATFKQNQLTTYIKKINQKVQNSSYIWQITRFVTILCFQYVLCDSANCELQHVVVCFNTSFSSCCLKDNQVIMLSTRKRIGGRNWFHDYQQIKFDFKGIISFNSEVFKLMKGYHIASFKTKQHFLW